MLCLRLSTSTGMLVLNDLTPRARGLMGVMHILDLVRLDWLAAGVHGSAPRWIIRRIRW